MWQGYVAGLDGEVVGISGVRIAVTGQVANPEMRAVTFTRLLVPSRRRAVLAPGLVAQPVTMTKAAVGQKIRQVEDGVDQFRDYLNQRGENARSAAANSQGEARQGR